MGGRSGALCVVLGGRIGRAQCVDVLRFAAAGEPAVECARCNGGSARRSHRFNAAAATRDRHRTYRDQPDRRSRCTAVFPVRSRGTSISLAKFRDKNRVRRSAVTGKSCADPRLPSAPVARDRRSRRSRKLDHVMGIAAGASIAILRSGDDARIRSGLSRLYERHDRTAQRRADAAILRARQSAGLCLFAQRLSTTRRSLLVAGGLGMDRRLDGCAIAGALFRPAHRRLSRPLRARTRTAVDRAVSNPQFVPLPDGAQDDDEGVSAAARRVRRQFAQHHERRRSGWNDGVRMGARRARRHDQRDVRTNRDELHRRQLAYELAGEARFDGAALSGASNRRHRRIRQ